MGFYALLSQEECKLDCRCPLNASHEGTHQDTVLKRGQL